MTERFKFDRVETIHVGARSGGYKFPAVQTWLYTGRRVILRFNWRP